MKKKEEALRSEDLKGFSAQVSETIQKGAEFLFSVLRDGEYWCAELESNTTVTSEYVFMCVMLNLDFSDKKEKIALFLLNQQKQDGSWGIAPNCEGDVSTTAESYLALRFLGLDQTDPSLLRAETFIRQNGGLEKVRVFSRIFLAMFGLAPWSIVPAIPPEFMLLPPVCPVNIYSLASWARGTMIPLFIIFHHRPVYALPAPFHEKMLDHLWLNPDKKEEAFASCLVTLVKKNKFSWKSLFGIAEPFIKIYDRYHIKSIRKKALEKCMQYVLEHQAQAGDWGGIFPPTVNGIIALTLQGYALDSEPVKRGLDGLLKFSWEDPLGYRIQASASPVWDTVLSAISLIDANCEPNLECLKRAMKWVGDRQILVEYGDWKVYRPHLKPGGWAFEYENAWYPDVDDTAAVVLAMLKQDAASAQSLAVISATEWILGMQNKDGGWAAFDVNNDKEFLNHIPFSDMDSLCDPSSPDVTGRVLEAYGLLLSKLPPSGSQFPTDLHEEIVKSCNRGLKYLIDSQEKEGSWYGRWGVNYIYGTSNVLCGLTRIKVLKENPIVERALNWLISVQNTDGGWGEKLESYRDKKWMGIGESTPSQTAWALMGLLSYLPPEHPAIHRGIQWLVKEQKHVQPIDAYEGGVHLPKARGASWEEATYTGTGFPNHFYLRYNYYRHYFPMMALGRYFKALSDQLGHE